MEPVYHPQPLQHVIRVWCVLLHKLWWQWLVVDARVGVGGNDSHRTATKIQYALQIGLTLNDCGTLLSINRGRAQLTGTREPKTTKRGWRLQRSSSVDTAAEEIVVTRRIPLTTTSLTLTEYWKRSRHVSPISHCANHIPPIEIRRRLIICHCRRSQSNPVQLYIKWNSEAPPQSDWNDYNIISIWLRSA